MVDETKQQDVDLLYILRRIKQSIRNFFGGIGWLISFSTKNFLRLLVFIILAVGISVGLNFMKRGYFVSSVTIGHTRVDNDYCKELVNNLGSYIDGGSNLSLAEALHLDSNYAKEVRSIKYKPLNENVARRYADSSSVLLPFKVEVEVYSTNVLDSLQERLLAFLEKTDFATRRKELDMLMINRTEQRLRQEVGEIDSLKDIVNQSIIPRGNGTGIIYGEPLDPVNIYKRSMELFEKRILLERRQTLINSFEVIIDFNKSAKRADLNIIFYILSGILIGYLVGLFWLLPKKTV